MSDPLNDPHGDHAWCKRQLRQAEETRDAAQAEATKQTLLKRKLRDAAVELMNHNGGPIRSLENRIAAGDNEDYPDDYVMVRMGDFKALWDAM